MFKFFKKKLVPDPAAVNEPTDTWPITEQKADIPGVDFTLPLCDAEREEAALIASAIMAGDQPVCTFRVKNIARIDTDKEAAAAIAAAVLTAERSGTVFQLKSITEVTEMSS